MAAIAPGRLTVDLDRDVVVFLIGMRVNRWWRPDLWLPVAMSMPRMLKELQGRTDLGYLGGEQAFGNPTIMVQYWASAEHLMDYAKAKEHVHLPAWIDFRKRVQKTNAVGVWHETYRVERSAVECIYVNMPPFGLGRVAPRVPAVGHRRHARARLAMPA
jgi:hypothetical protein